MPLLTILIIPSFLLIIGMCFYGLHADRLPFSLNKIFWIFCLFFMGLSPLLQYITGILPFAWIKNQANAYSFVATNCLILVCQLAYLFLYRRWSDRSGVHHKRFHTPAFDKQFISRYNIWGNLIYCSALLLQLLTTNSIWNRGHAEASPVITDSSLQLLADKGGKGLVLYFCLLSIQLLRRKQISLRQLALVLSPAILINFPTGIARYWLATFYLGLLLSWAFPFFVKHKRLFSTILISSLLVLFPLLSLTRQNCSTTNPIPPMVSDQTVLHKILANSFCGQDFDAYASLRNTILYVQQDGVTWGKQALTVGLFFVPRKIWPNKGIGSGALVIPPRPGSDFNNYSSPLFAEGYINFGAIGALLFAAAFGLLCARYDRYYWHSFSRFSYIKLFYPAFIGLAFFILRGDLLSSFAYTAGLFVSGLLFHILLTRRLS